MADDSVLYAFERLVEAEALLPDSALEAVAAALLSPAVRPLVPDIIVAKYALRLLGSDAAAGRVDLDTLETLRQLEPVAANAGLEAVAPPPALVLMVRPWSACGCCTLHARAAAAAASRCQGQQEQEGGARGGCAHSPPPPPPPPPPVVPPRPPPLWREQNARGAYQPRPPPPPDYRSRLSWCCRRCEAPRRSPPTPSPSPTSCLQTPRPRSTRGMRLLRVAFEGEMGQRGERGGVRHETRGRRAAAAAARGRCPPPLHTQTPPPPPNAQV